MKYAANIAEVSKLPIDYMGFIFYPKSARYIDHPDTSAVARPIKKVGVFVDESIETIERIAEQEDLSVIQLHGSESIGQCEALQKRGLEVIKAFGIDEHFDWSIVADYLPVVDFFLFDTKSPRHGGTGKVFNWEKIKEYPCDKSFFLSGGLSLENIAQAASYNDQRLVGLDLNSRFEIEPGLKNIETLTQALKIINNE